MKVWLVITALSWNGVLVTNKTEMPSMKECMRIGKDHVAEVNARGSTKAIFACWRNDK